MLIKIIVMILFAVILGSLASGLVYLVKDSGDSKRVVKALTVRVAISMLAFVILLIGVATGLIRPHGLLPTAPPSAPQTYIQ